MTLHLSYVALLAVGVFVIHRLFEVRRRLKAGPNVDGDILLIDPDLRLPLPDWKWCSRNSSWSLTVKHSRHAAAGSDNDIVYRAVLFPFAKVTYMLADPVAVKEVGARRQTFHTPAEVITLMKPFGHPSILTSEGELHKRQRRAIAPAFSDRNMELVWSEAVRVVLELFKTDDWDGRSTVMIENITSLTTQMTLHVITGCGFGHEWSWKQNSMVSAGGRMRFQDAIQILAYQPWVKLIIPRWMAWFKQSWAEVHVAFDELQVAFGEMIAHRRSGHLRLDRQDLLSGLIAAEERSECDKMRITEQEIISNCIVLLLGGYETSAHALAFLLGELAADPEKQEKVYAEILANVSTDGVPPSYKDMHKFPLVLATFHEALRLWPISTNFLKATVQDTVLPTANGRSHLIPKGSLIEQSLTALHYNPKYWSDAEAFKPERFLEPDCPRDAFVAFSTGPRACIGRRFAETEVVAFVVALLMRYRIEVPDNPQWGTLSPQDIRKKLLDAKMGLTYYPRHAPLVFVVRT
ncbi:cytochrome P450 [Auriculariales sp. MPI-PUGE-AT-0066]|nr:cytochrome P450 [Auriculariales sp. MPI-PUGE-AT-0066]